MKTRLLLGAVGIAMALWGAWLAVQVPQIIEFGAWFLAGPILHDAVLAPFVAAVGLVFFVEFVDNTIKTGDDVSRYAQLPTLGVIPVISAGGVETAADVRERLDAGATLVQGYTAFLYRGPLWARQLNRGLARPSA